MKLISADTFKDQKSRAPDGDTALQVTLRVDTKNLTDRQASIAIRLACWPRLNCTLVRKLSCNTC